MANRKRRNRGRRRNRRRNVGSLGQNVQLAHRLCSVSDPFCNHSYGAKQPGGAPAVTVGYTTRATGTLTTTTQGVVNLFFRASASTCNLTINNPVTAKQFNNQTLITAEMGAHPSFVERTRIVSAGIRLWPIYAMTATQGSMYVIPVNDNTALFDGNDHAHSALVSTSEIHIGKMGEFQYNLYPLENEYTFFKDATTTQTVSLTDQDWSSVLIILDGSVSTTYMAYEAVIHYEGIVTSTSSTAIGGSQIDNRGAEPIVKAYQKNKNNYGGFISGTRERVERYLKDHAAAAAKKAGMYLLRKGASLAWEAIEGPEAAAAGYIMDEIIEVD